MKYGVVPQGSEFKVFVLDRFGRPVGSPVGTHLERSSAMSQRDALNLKGGQGSGNYGHKGRKGQRGGSSSDGSGGGKTPSGMLMSTYRQKLDDMAAKENAQRASEEPLPDRFEDVTPQPDGSENVSRRSNLTRDREFIHQNARPGAKFKMADGTIGYLLGRRGDYILWSEKLPRAQDLEDPTKWNLSNAIREEDISQLLTGGEDWLPRLFQDTKSLPTSDEGESMISFGSSVKALGNGRIGGHLVLYGNQEEKDFYGDWFSPETYVGPNDADGRDVTINHRLAIKTGMPDVDMVMKKFTSNIFKPGGLKTRRDELGIFGEVICDLSDEYDRKIYELAEQGKLKWSSGAARHMIEREPNGQLKMFVIAEGALTPIPAEPRMVLSRVMPLKSLTDMWDLKGGKGSGNFGHKGRTGQRGGSSSDGSARVLRNPATGVRLRNELQDESNVLRNPATGIPLRDELQPDESTPVGEDDLDGLPPSVRKEELSRIRSTDEFKKKVQFARRLIFESDLPSGVVIYSGAQSGKLNAIDTDTWLNAKLSEKYTKVATVFSRFIEDEDGKELS